MDNIYYVYVSRDGISWGQAVASHKLVMGVNTKVRMAVSSHNEKMASTAIFSSVAAAQY